MLDYPDFLPEEEIIYYPKMTGTDGISYGTSRTISGKILIRLDRRIDANGLTIESKGSIYFKGDSDVSEQGKVEFQGVKYTIDQISRYRHEGQTIYTKAGLI